MIAAPFVLDEHVLVLNRLYTAVRVVNARRAFSLLCKSAAEVVSLEQEAYVTYDLDSWTDVALLQRAIEPEAHEWVRTPSLQIAVPKIIRLFDYDRFPDRHVKLTRRNLYTRDANRCQYCGHRCPTNELTIDHVVPRVQGGANTWRNLVCCCLPCNTRKGGRTPTQAGVCLLRRPVEPSRKPAVRLRIGRRRYDSWKAFLNEAYWTVELRD